MRAEESQLSYSSGSDHGLDNNKTFAKEDIEGIACCISLFACAITLGAIAVDSDPFGSGTVDHPVDVQCGTIRCSKYSMYG